MSTSHFDLALERFKHGGFVIVTDDEKRENEGDLFLLGSAATTEKIAFMIRYTSGVICVAMTEARSRQLHLPLMVKNNQDTKRTAFTVTVDAKEGITTGISAEERARTIALLADGRATAEDFIRPGHIFPLIAHESGLKGRQGHTEAVVELCRLAGDVEVGVISELVNEDGSMMRGAELQEFSRKQDIPILTIAELLQVVTNSVSIKSETPALHWADLPRSSKTTWKITTYLGRGGVDHAILKFGLDLENQDLVSQRTTQKPTLVRVHSECLTGDVLGSMRCDCGSQLQRAMELIEESGAGLIIYLRDQEGRGIGLSEKIRAYELQDQGLDTVEANLALGHDVDERDFNDAAEILRSLGILNVTLLTNNPIKLQTLQDAGIHVTSQTLHGETNPFNQRYIDTKRERLGHN
ncbi:MAG: 3,4-dihydroxy-2-butanone-4-phosphate synthase [Actinomycetota bacterium]